MYLGSIHLGKRCYSWQWHPLCKDGGGGPSRGGAPSQRGGCIVRRRRRGLQVNWAAVDPAPLSPDL
uniref:Uncharacterized protein n=1 Tax=Oryza sativa subsp. japonica TaxID=39947 RepID=Q6Z283_ORYSJ|nr:hypothetical protein [Oryza sativa Japonica Group]